jgi:hypothetical protein
LPGVGVLPGADLLPGSILLGAADVERWSLPAAAVVLAATVLLAVRHRRVLSAVPGPAFVSRLALAPGLAVLIAPSWLAAAVVTWRGRPQLSAADVATVPTAWRLGLGFGLLAAVALAAAARPVLRAAGDAVRDAGDVLLSWPVAPAATAGAGVLALTASGVFDVVVEVATGPTGALALAVGALRLAARPAEGSWRTLGPGLALLLLPTLVLAAGGDLWRVLALVMVAGAALAMGAARGLQAPVVLGAGVLAVHAAVQLAPYLGRLTSSQWRWVVFAAVGAGLLTLGATYERRLVQLRAARTRVAALR